MTFDEAVFVILDIEKGLVDDPNDPGGLTKYGITQRSYPHLDIRNLTKMDAIKIYRDDFWDLLSCDKLPDKLKLPVFDAGVNQGVVAAAKMLQRLIGATADGVIGERTLERAWMSPSLELPQLYLEARLDRYVRTKNSQHFLVGWCRRLIIVSYYTGCGSPGGLTIG